MMQPLADLYFVVVLEHLKDKKGSGMTLEGALHTIKTVQDVSYLGTSNLNHMAAAPALKLLDHFVGLIHMYSYSK